MEPHAHIAYEDISLPGLLRGLGDVTRLRIVRNLYAAGRPLTCQEAVAGIENLPAATRSHCFRVLRDTGLIYSDKQGRECFNRLRWDELEQKFPGLLESVLTAEHYSTTGE